MEKKVPERKVSLREEDVFYVYDKRINKCVKEDCAGIVKYGLVLRVTISEAETCNCFECNKCHMKYTPYPNYVRLSKTDMLTIYNQAEVTARDEKRAEDARKQLERERRNSRKQFNDNNKPFHAKHTYNKDRFDKERKPYKKEKYGNIVITTGNYRKKDDRPQHDGGNRRYDDTRKHI